MKKHTLLKLWATHTHRTLTVTEVHHALTLDQCRWHSAILQFKALYPPVQIKTLHLELLTSSLQELQPAGGEYYQDIILDCLVSVVPHFGHYGPDYMASSLHFTSWFVGFGTAWSFTVSTQQRPRTFQHVQKDTWYERMMEKTA
jgi:hypothetical protein